MGHMFTLGATAALLKEAFPEESNIVVSQGALFPREQLPYLSGVTSELR